MSTWLFLSLLAPFLWALNNNFDSIVRKLYIKDDVAVTWIASILQVVFVIIFFLFFDAKSSSLWPTIIMIAAGVVWIVPVFFYYKAIHLEETSRIAIFLQFIPVFALVFAFLLLNETLDYYQIIAFVLILFAGICASLRRIKKKWSFSKAFLLMLIACALWAISDVVFKKYEPDFINFSSAFTFFTIGSVIPAILVLANKTIRQRIFNNLKNLKVRGLGYVLLSKLSTYCGSLAFGYALTLGKASLTAVMIGIQPLFVILQKFILRPFFRELEPEDLKGQALVFKGLAFILVIIGLIYLQL